MVIRKASMFIKSFAAFLVFVMAALVCAPAAAAAAGKAERYPFVFVSGYGGYGQYDGMNESFPYWGMRSGDLLADMRTEGFECYAASVDPVGSAWDRACELYAQLTGTVVDYGAVHSARSGHSRFGTDYSQNPLLTGWGESGPGGIKKLNFVGHSFGGTTIRVLTCLLADGSAGEAAGTDGAVSGLFTGGKSEWVNSVTTLSTPHNGSTVVDAYRLFKPFVKWGGKKIVGNLRPTSLALIDYALNFGKAFVNGIGSDTGIYALTLDGAAEINEGLRPLENVYYFSFATDTTKQAQFLKTRVPDKNTDAIFPPMVFFMGSLTGVTPGGIVFDEQWFANDGVVNTMSCLAPFHEAQQNFDAGSIRPGVWNVMPVYRGDHASIIGGVLTPRDIRGFYETHLAMIDGLTPAA